MSSTHVFLWAPLELYDSLVAELYLFLSEVRGNHCVDKCAYFVQIRIQWGLVYYLQPPLEVLDLILVVVESPLEVTVVPGGSLF